MKKHRLIWVIAVWVAGCSTFYLDSADLLREANTENLKRLAPGMDKAVVVQIMGTEPSKSLFMWIDNPYRSESIVGKDGRTYEVLYYYTDLKQRDDKITDDELTPVIFAEGKLVGWGYDVLRKKAR